MRLCPTTLRPVALAMPGRWMRVPCSSACAVNLGMIVTARAYDDAEMRVFRSESGVGLVVMSKREIA
ncbi:MAG: hypothetical protein IRZ13_00640 [Acetobacteraceae bacterium]|nr:hypothetical protein [Acetobacteraceae bacterium]